MEQLTFKKVYITPSVVVLILLFIGWVWLSIYHSHIFWDKEPCDPICLFTIFINSTVFLFVSFGSIIAALTGQFDNYKLSMYLPSFQVSQEDEILIELGKACVNEDEELQKLLFDKLYKLNEK